MARDEAMGPDDERRVLERLRRAAAQGNLPARAARNLIQSRQRAREIAVDALLAYDRLEGSHRRWGAYRELREALERCVHELEAVPIPVPLVELETKAASDGSPEGEET
jgi:hypothetical protein